MKDRIRILPFPKTPRFVAGVDAAYSRAQVIAAVCVFTYPELRLVEEKSAVHAVTFPYRSGFLSFREGPAVQAAVSSLKTKPDVILLDGQGIAHPLKMGIASHMGVILETPTIGCAKSRLVGEYEEPGISKGSTSALLYRKTMVGAVLRIRNGTRPLFISPGHLIDVAGAVRIVLGCLTDFRIPEPLRRADRLSRIVKLNFRD